MILALQASCFSKYFLCLVAQWPLTSALLQPLLWADLTFVFTNECTYTVGWVLKACSNWILISQLVWLVWSNQFTLTDTLVTSKQKQVCPDSFKALITKWYAFSWWHRTHRKAQAVGNLEIVIYTNCGGIEVFSKKWYILVILLPVSLS